MSAPPQDGPLDQIRRVLAAQTKMHAIKKYRDATGSGWAAAAEAVDTIRAGGTPGTGPEAQRLRGRSATVTDIPSTSRIVERRRVSPMLVLVSLAAVSGAMFGFVYLLTRG